jgi:hypothetical protein
MGTREFARRGVRKAARLMASAARAERRERERVEVDDPRTLAQLRALSFFRSSLESAAAERARLATRRRRGDREIFARFPLWIVPTYPGDDALFASPAFASWLPADLRFERATLAEVMAWPD